MNEISGALSNLQKFGIPEADPILNDLLAEIYGFADLLKECGAEVAIESPAARAAWAHLESGTRYGILKNFSTYHRNCRELHAAGVSLRDNHAFILHSVKQAKLFAKDNTDNLFTNDHMVEVYNLDNVQISRSINFFDYCNYSLLDLLAREWMDLYERLPSVTKSLFSEVNGSVSTKELRYFNTPPHIMKERDANPCGVFQTHVLSCCPLYNSPGSLAGYLLVLEVAEIDVDTSNQQKVAFLRN